MLRLIAKIPKRGGTASPGSEGWLKIAGDKAKGFSLTAHNEPHKPPLYDYWFATLEEAFEAGKDYEVAQDSWHDEERSPGTVS